MDERSNISNCRKCEAPIRWVKTAKGKNMPLDEKPSDSIGEFALVPDTDPQKVDWISERARSNHPGPLFSTHFKTCRYSKENMEATDGY